MSRSKPAVHGPDCLACTDPAEAARQVAEQRAELDREATRAREHRTAGEALRARALDNLLAGRSTAHAELEARGVRHLRMANGLASGVRMARAHLDRVETAHPMLSAEGTSALTTEWRRARQELEQRP